MKNLIGKYVFITLLVMYQSISFATDLGVIGQVYPIAEEDFLVFLQKRAQIMKQNGDWIKYQNEWREKVAKNADRPHPIKGITKTKTTTSWYYDPSITLPYDLKDANGHIFSKAGTKVNPLSFMKLHKALLFIDADDESQVRWAINKYKTFNENNEKAKIVLIKGSVFTLVKELKQRIYFDQEGRLTNRFNIQHVPAFVVAEDEQLKITEEVAHE